MKSLAKLGLSTLVVAAVGSVFFMPGTSRASDQGFVHFGCIEINSSLFEKEATGIGSSCAVFNREQVAENRALDDIDVEGEIQCDTVDDANPSFYEAYCQAVCEFNGFEESTGIGMCDFTITDEDAWRVFGDGCMGGRAYHRIEADVQCGCNCRTYIEP